MNLPCDNPAILPVSERESMHEGFLQRHFDVAFAAPDGIKKLRELILTLAMQGKLVPQDPNDPPASELLKAIEAEKQRRVEEGKIKMPKPLAAIKPEEVPYQLPEGWEWVRLGDVGITQTGTTPKNGDSVSYGNDFPFIKPADITADNVNYENEGLSEVGISKYGRLAPAGSSLMVCIGTIGKTNIIEKDCSFNQQINSITPYAPIYGYYLQQYLRSKYFQNEAWARSSSTTIAILNKGRWESIHIALPPFPEQHRIVAKIDQLMARCDELEKLRAEREQKRRAVHHAAIKRLLDAASSFPRRRESSASDHSPGCADLDPSLCGGDGRGDADKEAFADGWQFIARHFNELYSVKENVTELRKTILQLAVMGKLVPQDLNDPPASILLKAIETEKQRLVKEGKIKAAKPLPSIQPEEIPYELPQGWEWVRLREISSKITDGDHKTPPRIPKGYRLLSAKNVRDGYVDIDNCDYISEEHYLKSRERCCPEFNDLLIVSVGGTIGRTSLVPNDSDFALVRSVALIKPLCINSAYLKYSMDSSLLQNSIHARKRGGAQPCLYLSEIEKFFFSLPPLPEQHRIVAKVDQLMALCDTLENQIDAVSNQQTALLNALMAQG